MLNGKILIYPSIPRWVSHLHCAPSPVFWPISWRILDAATKWTLLFLAKRRLASPDTLRVLIFYVPPNRMLTGKNDFPNGVCSIDDKKLVSSYNRHT